MSAATSRGSPICAKLRMIFVAMATVAAASEGVPEVVAGPSPLHVRHEAPPFSNFIRDPNVQFANDFNPLDKESSESELTGNLIEDESGTISEEVQEEKQELIRKIAHLIDKEYFLHMNNARNKRNKHPQTYAAPCFFKICNLGKRRVP